MAQPTPDERKSDLAVMDASEYDQKRRLKRLHEKLESYHEKKEEAWELYVTGQISADGRALQHLHAVQDLIEELWELTLDDLEGEHDEYWNNTKDQEAIVGIIERPTKEDVVFKDLWDILHAKDYYEERQEQSLDRRHGPNQVVQQSEEFVVPEWISRNAYLRVKEYLSDRHDMRLKFEEIDDTLPMFGFEEVDENGE